MTRELEAMETSETAAGSSGRLVGSLSGFADTIGFVEVAQIDSVTFVRRVMVTVDLSCLWCSLQNFDSEAFQSTGLPPWDPVATGL